MSKYYLLTFDEDYGDEHNVPALACMNEEEYQKWLESPSGKLNPKFEEQNKIYQEYAAKDKALNKWLSDNNLWSKPINTFTEEEKAFYDANKVDYKLTRNPPKKVESQMSAHLGNSGECFEESYNHLYLMKEFVEAKIVKVTEVDESFKTYFDKANLSSLSLCNVFDVESLTEEDYDDEDIEEEDE